MKIAAQPLSIPLTYIYNHSIETGIVPDILKVSQICLVYKGGDATDSSNYRPIVILSPLSKVLARLVYNQLYSFIDNTKSWTNISLDLGKDIPLNKLFLKLLTIWSLLLIKVK